MPSKKLSECHNISYDVICNIRKGKVDKARAVIEKYGLGYSESWSQGYVLLREALKNRHKKLAKYILTLKNVKVNKHNKFPIDTPLHLAAFYGYKDIVKSLLNLGADINALNARGMTPHELAADSKHISIVELFLLQKNVNFSSVNIYQLLHSASKSSVIVVQNLLDKGLEVDIVKDGLTPLHRAAFSSCLAVVKCLVEHKADVNAVSSAKNYLGYTPLHFATIKPNAEVVEFLLENGAHIDLPSKSGSTPFSQALVTGNDEVVNVFLRYGININAIINKKSGWTPLQFAIDYNKESVVAILLKNGADLQLLDKNGRNILHFTLSRGVSSLMIWEILVNYGANVNALDKFTRQSRESLLHLAVKDLRNRMSVIVEFLINHGANVDAVDATGATPIFYSIRNNQYRNEPSTTTILLLEASANVNAKDLSGKTPLHVACELGNIHDVLILLKYGADINSRCLNNNLPIDCCTARIPDAFKDNRVITTEKILEIVHQIYRQAVVLHLAGLHVDYKYYQLQSICPNCHSRATTYEENVTEEFRNELNDLKKKYIVCNLTFYSLLTKSQHELAIYKQNPAVIKAVQSVDFLTEFPIYGGVIRRNLAAASARIKMIEESQKRNIYRIFPETPIEVADYIFMFLNNDDFYNLVRAL